MDLEKEVRELKSLTTQLRIVVAIIVITFMITAFTYQVQYSKIRSYYQSTANLNQELQLELEKQNVRLQGILSEMN